MSTDMSGEMLIPVYIILLTLCTCLCVDLTYHEEEEQGPGTYIGDIAADSQLLNSLPSEVRGLITFSQLQESMIISSLFNVTKTGKLYAAQTLDAESLCTYNLECFKIVKVAVRQAEAYMKILKVKVIIEDINDHKPEFPNRQVRLNFSERDGKGRRISIPNAIDKDVGLLNSQVTYSLQRNTDELFTLAILDRVVGTDILEIVLQERLDREIKDTYSLQVIAKDGGSPPRQSILNVEISVDDVNDNRPVFSQDVYNVSIRNTQQKSIPITILSATDLDSGKNGKVSYYFGSETSDSDRSLFKLNHETGEIFQNENFTSGPKLTYRLLVEARDEGSIPLTSTALVIVHVINQQNTPPKIHVNFVSTLTENMAAISERIKVGSFIAYVSVIDNDLGLNGEVECNLKDSNFQLLNLGSKEYKIIVKDQVDREKRDFYNITIICQDKGFTPLQAVNSFTIKVLDINDVQPKFTKDAYKFLIYENEAKNFPIGFINATDPDLGPGGQLSYSILDHSENGLPFGITNNGFISTTMILDYEQEKMYKFQLLVKDNGTPSLNNTANIIVEVMDENDNAPYFTFPSVSPFNIDFHHHPQSKNDITVLRASDRDSHVNAFLRYELLEGNDNQLFIVNSYTGVLSFSRPVYQNDAGSYDLQFVVKDSGTPVLSATTTLSLTLTISNKTSTMLTAVQLQSKEMIDMNLSIAIVVVAVIFSVIIVVAITICIVRYNNLNNISHSPEVDQLNQSKSEMRHLIYQTSSNPGATIIRVPEDMLNGNTNSLTSTTPLYSVVELPNDWRIATLSRRPPVPTQVEGQQRKGETSCQKGVEESGEMSPQGKKDIASSNMDIEHIWIRGDSTKHYEEIPALRFPKENIPYI